MSNFKDRLWRDLVREHGAELNENNEPARPGLWMRPRLLFGGGLAGVAGVATAVAIALGTAGTSPAFAVTQNHDGSYTVQLWRASGITGLNARLEQLGLPARAVQVRSACAATWSVAGPPSAPPAGGSGRAANWTTAQAKIDPHEIPKGKFLELPMANVHGQTRMLAGRAATAVAANAIGCQLPSSASCPPPQANVQSGGTATGASTTGTSTTGTGTGTSTSSTTTSETQTPVTGATTTGATTTGGSTTTTGTGTTSAGGGSGLPQSGPSTIKLAGSPAQVRAGVLVPAPGCGAPSTMSAGPGTNSTGAGTNSTGTSTSSTGTSTAAAPLTKAGS